MHIDHAPDLRWIELAEALRLERPAPSLLRNGSRPELLLPQLLGDLAQRESLLAEPNGLGDHGLLGFILDQGLVVLGESVSVRDVAAGLLAIVSALGETFVDPRMVASMEFDVCGAQLLVRVAQALDGAFVDRGVVQDRRLGQLGLSLFVFVLHDRGRRFLHCLQDSSSRHDAGKAIYMTEESTLSAEDIASWAAFLPTVRVGGALPVTFRQDGDYVVVEVIVPYVPPEPSCPPTAWIDAAASASGPRKIPIAIAEGFPVPIAARYRLPAFQVANAADFLRHITREIYKHEIDEQLRVAGSRPFAPEH